MRDLDPTAAIQVHAMGQASPDSSTWKTPRKRRRTPWISRDDRHKIRGRSRGGAKAAGKRTGELHATQPQK